MPQAADPRPPADSGRWPASGPSPGRWQPTGRCLVHGTSSQPGMPSGQFPRPGTGPMPRGRIRSDGRRSASPARRRPGFRARCRAPRVVPMPRAATGPVPRAGTGPMPRAAAGPMPRERAAAQAALRSGFRADAAFRDGSAGLADVRPGVRSVPARRDGSAAGGRHRPPARSVARIRADAGRQVNPRPALSAYAAASGDGPDAADRVRAGSAWREPPATPGDPRTGRTRETAGVLRAGAGLPAAARLPVSGRLPGTVGWRPARAGPGAQVPAARTGDARLPRVP